MVAKCDYLGASSIIKAHDQVVALQKNLCG